MLFEKLRDRRRWVSHLWRVRLTMQGKRTFMKCLAQLKKRGYSFKPGVGSMRPLPKLVLLVPDQAPIRTPSANERDLRA